MSKLALSTRLFAGAIAYFAEYSAAASDASTKPASDSDLWKEIGLVQSLEHVPEEFVDQYSEVTSTGWANRKDVFVLADIYRLKTHEVSELYHRLDMGTSAALVAGTAQAPFANQDRKVLGWVKFQHRMHTGTDRQRLDVYCEVRLAKSAPIDKKVAEPELELYVLASSLNSVVIPS